MKIRVTITREYEMDEVRVLSEPGFKPPENTCSGEDFESPEIRAWLKESFWELCGWQRDEDHLDGGYVWMLDEDSDVDYFWPVAGASSVEGTK